MIFAKRSSIVAAILSACICAGVSAKPQQTQNEIMLLKAVRSIRKQEQAVKNIRFHFINKDWTWNSVKKKWGVAGLSEGMAVYDGMPWGKCRVDIHHSVAKWLDGPAPFNFEAYSVGYNGRVGTFLQTMTGLQKMAAGSPTQVWPVYNGHVSGHRPRMINDGATGWYNSLFGFTSLHFGNHPRFSSYIAPVQNHITLHADWIHSKGKRYLEVTRIAYIFRKSIFLLDPRKSYSIAQYVSYGIKRIKSNSTGQFELRTSQRIFSDFHVTAFSEPLSGIYFPSKIHGENFTFNPIERPQSRYSIFISKVTVNDPKVNDATYMVRFPRNSIVTDTATNKTIRIGGTLHQQIKDIEKAVNQARKAIATEPAASRP